MAVVLPAPVRPRPAPLPGEWSFWCDTITGDRPLGPVTPRGFSCTWRLSSFGNGQATLPADNPAMTQAEMLRLWSWRMWCLFGDPPVPLWCGVPTGIADEGGVYVTVTFTELTAYLRKRQWDRTGARYSQVEQTAIAADIAAPLADLGVAVATDPGPGFPRDRSYEYLEGQNRGELLSNLAGVISGPEFRTEYQMSGARPACTLRIAYPRVGAEAGLAVTVPGDTIGYRAGWDSDRLRTRTFSVGELPENAAEGTPRPVVVEDRPQPGLPRLDEVDDWPGTILVSTLRERALSAAHTYREPALDLSVTQSQMSPPLGSYAVGDDVAVQVTSPLLPGGLDARGRLTEATCSAGEGTVSWTVALDQPPPAPRETLTGHLGRLDRLTRGIFRRNLTPL